MAKLERESEHIEPLSMEISVVDSETNKTIFMRFYTSQELRDEPPPSPPPTATPHTATPETQTQPPPPFTQNNSPESQNVYANNEANTQPPPVTQNTPPETQTQQCPTYDIFSQQSPQEIPCSKPTKKKSKTKQHKMPKTTTRIKGLSSSKAKESNNEAESSDGRGRRNNNKISRE